MFGRQERVNLLDTMSKLVAESMASAATRHNSTAALKAMADFAETPSLNGLPDLNKAFTDSAQFTLQGDTATTLSEKVAGALFTLVYDDVDCRATVISDHQQVAETAKGMALIVGKHSDAMLLNLLRFDVVSSVAVVCKAHETLLALGTDWNERVEHDDGEMMAGRLRLQ